MPLLRPLALWFGLLAVGVILLLALCPRILTGSYADVTITKITQTFPGQYSVECTARTAAGTTLSTGFYDGKKFMGGGSGGNNGFFGWPITGSLGVMFTLDPESQTGHTPLVPRPDRLLIKEGQTATLHPGQRLYFFDFTTADGIRHDGYIEVESSGSRK
jgi:hypothetical protein